jgi:hypothetical protein
MTAIDTNTNKSYDSRFACRIAKQIGVTEDTIYRWCSEGIQIKQYKNYLIYLDSKTL